MTGRGVLSLTLGLWAVSAGAQTTTPPSVVANLSIFLDGGVSSAARAYVVTSGGGQYAMANAGNDIQVFSVVDGLELASQPGPYLSIAVADGILLGNLTANLVVGARQCVTVCLDIFSWDATNGFIIQATAVTNMPDATAMAIDATSSPIRIYFATSGLMLYEQDITVNAMGAIVVGGATSRSVTTGGSSTIQGLTVIGGEVAFSSTTAGYSSIYVVPTDFVSSSTQTTYSAAPGGGFSQVQGLFYYSALPAPYVLGGGVNSGVYALNPGAFPGANIVVGSVNVLTSDAGRVTIPSGASVNALANLTLVTEDLFTDGGGPWLHIVSGINLFPDGGPFPVPDAGTDAGTTDGGTTDAGSADAGGIPTIPGIQPGPGALPMQTNSCNCSTAGSAPVLLALLLPLLLPRRRRT